MRYLILIFILLARTASAATGDVLGASTTNGQGQVFYNPSCQLSLYFDNMLSGGTINTGFSNSPFSGGVFLAYSATNIAAAKIRVSATSQGYDESGNLTTYKRTIYGTVCGRLPYPNNASLNIVTSGTTLIAPFCLSDFLFTNDSNIVVSVDAGAYTAPDLNCDNYATATGSANIAAGDAAFAAATRITAGCTTTVTQIVVSLSAPNGNPGHNITAQIYSDSAGTPGSLIGTASSSIAESTIGTTEQDVTFTGLSASVTTGTHYWVLLSYDGFENSFPITWFYVNDPNGVIYEEGGAGWKSLATGVSGKFKFNSF